MNEDFMSDITPWEEPNSQESTPVPSAQATPNIAAEAEEAELMEGITPWGSQEEPMDTEAKDAEIGERLGNVKVAFGPWEAEETTWADVIGEDATAGLVGLGAGMSDTWRGVKQMFGIDAEEEAENERIMNELYGSEEYGTEAMAGLIGGAVADPAGLIVGGGTAKAVQVARIMKNMNKVKQAAVSGAIVGGAQTGTGYIDEEGSINRLQMAALGATLGGGLGYWGGKSAAKAENKLLVDTHQKNIRELEEAVGSIISKESLTPDEAVAIIKKGDPDLVKRALDSAKEIGEQPDLVNAGKNYEFYKAASKGDMPIEAVVSKLKTEGKGLGSADKLLGVISSQVKKLNPRVFGKLRRYDANMARHPEKYRKIREGFAEYFPTQSGRHTGEKVMSQTDIDIFNHKILNQEFDEAREFLRTKRGSKAVKEFDKTLKVYDELGDELVSIGALDKKMGNYWHRSINMDKYDEFMEVLKKDMGKDIQTKWEAKLKELNKKAKEKRGYDLTDHEIARSFEAFVFGARPETYSVGALKGRKIKKIPQKYVQYYTNPIESLDSYIHTAVAEVEKAKFFGKEIYKSGITREGDFNLSGMLDNWKAVDMLKGMNPEDQSDLVDVINLRFGRGMQSANQFTQNYKSLVNMTLLGNPVSAITQFGDLGVSMYKNGIYRTGKHFLKNLPAQALEGAGVLKRGTTNRITIEDLGLEQRFQEFEDLAKKGELAKWQDRLFTWSGFSLVDRIGKEAMVNSAVEKAVKIASNPKSGAYKSWAKELRNTIGEADFIKLQNDLKTLAEKGMKKENMTDDVMAYAFSKLADVQPISKSEVPQAYLSSNTGKTAFTLKSFLLKQVDVLRNDVIREATEGSKIQAGKNLVAYTTLLGMMNLGADEVKQLVTGKKSLSDLPEEAQAITAGTLLQNIYGSTLKTFGFSGYTMRDIQKEGATGYLQSLIPPVPLADELVKIGMSIAYGDPDSDIISESTKRKLVGEIPMVGRIAAERVVPREEGEEIQMPSGEEEKEEESKFGRRFKEKEIEMLAEGGLVEKPEEESIPLEEVMDKTEEKPEEKKEEEPPKLQKLDPGVYQDEAGNFWEVGKNNKMKRVEFDVE